MLDTITLESFLRRDYENERECEYVDGMLIERTGGDTLHGLMHVEVASSLYSKVRDRRWDCLMSYSVQTSPTRIRVPDIVITPDRLREDIRKTPPLLCIEILAPEDRLPVLLPRLDEFVAMDVDPYLAVRAPRPRRVHVL
jgi:Uma2 family endonuclease